MKINIVKLIAAAATFVAGLFSKKTEGNKPDIASEVIDQVISLVDHVKGVVDSNLVVTVLKLLPLNILSGVRDKVSPVLADLITGLTFTKNMNVPGNDYAALNAAIARIQLSDDPDKNAFYHGLAARLIVVVSDGKVTWSEAVSLAEYYFKNIYKKEA